MGRGRARHIKNYVVSHLQEEHPEAVIIQAGGKDLAERKPQPIKNIANDVIEIALKSKQYAKDVYVGGVTVRATQFTPQKLKELNETLQALCKLHKLIFINNSSITTDHLLDGVHLSEEGTRLLANNYLDALDTLPRSEELK